MICTFVECQVGTFPRLFRFEFSEYLTFSGLPPPPPSPPTALSFPFPYLSVPHPSPPPRFLASNTPTFGIEYCALRTIDTPGDASAPPRPAPPRSYGIHEPPTNMRASSAYPQVSNRNYVKFVAIAVGVCFMFAFFADYPSEDVDAPRLPGANMRGSGGAGAG